MTKHVHLRISEDLDLPLDAITERLGWLGTSGSGKTYGAGKLAEEMLDVGAQIIVLDPVGPWWGLRSSADGKHAGLTITVFGGMHGDLPLTPESGSLVADVLVDRGISAVLDVSDFTVGEMHRFVSAFAERFFDRKKRSPSPVHLFLEEAHTFLPQNLPPEPSAAIMLHRLERIIRIGRNYGIGSSQISQMPQAITKRTLNVVACLFAFAALGKHERKALGDWFDQNGGGDLAKELPALPTGTAFAVSPRWLRLTKKITISAKRTFDSSETPKFGGARPIPKVLAPVDVEQLRVAMAETIAAATKDDPKALQKRVGELERQLAAKPAAAPAPKAEVVEKPVISEAHVKRLEREVLTVVQVAHSLSAQAAGLLEMVAPITAGLAAFKAPPLRALTIPARHVETNRGNGETKRATHETKPVEGETKLGRCERAILEALAVRRPNRLTRSQLSLISGYSGESGGFANSLGKLRAAALIETGSDGLTRLTDAGDNQVGHVATPREPQDVYNHWRNQVGRCEREVLRVMVEAFPNAVTRAELAQRSGYSADSGGFANALGKLRTLTLIENVAGGIRASDEIGGAR